VEPSALFPRDRATILGVLNVTPDSFSDGGRLFRGARADVAAAVDAAAALLAAGAHALDVGGESTRPGAQELPAEAEIERVAPVIEALAKRFEAPVSADTRKAPVAQAALEAGARWLNDVSGLRHDPALAHVAARGGAGLILGHLRGAPERMQHEIRFADVVAEVADELCASARAAEAAGVPRARLAVDPGIGFGKELEHNLALLARCGELRARVGLPLLVGPSRKSFLGRLVPGTQPAERDPASHAACAVAVFGGADAVRVHDAAGAAQAVRVAFALRGARAEGRA
jgi:dihydropteroate synthase